MNFSINCCTFEWVVNVSIGSWIPQSIIDNAFVNAMFNFMTFTRIHAHDLVTSKYSQELSESSGQSLKTGFTGRSNESVMSNNNYDRFYMK